jgi:hypothetical protein
MTADTCDEVTLDFNCECKLHWRTSSEEPPQEELAKDGRSCLGLHDYGRRDCSAIVFAVTALAKAARRPASPPVRSCLPAS